MQIVRWANSLAVRLPAGFVDRLRLSEGMKVGLRAKSGASQHDAQCPSFGEEAQNTLAPDTGAPGANTAAPTYRITVGRWGNSLAIRLPQALVARLGLSEGDAVAIAEGGPDMLEIEKELSIDELFDLIRTMRRTLPADYRFDREEANSREADGNS